MAITSSRASAATASPARPAWRLGARTRKWTLLLHVVSAGIWLGLDVAMAVLVATAILTDSDRTRALCYLALDLFAAWSLLTAGLVCLASGLVLGLGSKYGLIRYWWVAVKLALNLVLTSLVLIALRPGLLELADRSRQYLFGGADVDLSPGDMIFPPVVSTSCVLVAMGLAIFKPWGRLRKDRAGTRG